MKTEYSKDRYGPYSKVVYKAQGHFSLSLYVFKPCDQEIAGGRPAIIFFFGGGWTSGSPEQFYPQCRYFASKGFISISAEYRIREKHGTSPFESVKDAKSAIRWVRRHSSELGVSPGRIIASGGSAGGHIAACAALIRDHEDDGEDLDTSSVPDVLVLFNPVLDTTAKGYGSEKLDGRDTEISPVHHVRKGIPPAIIFHGTADTTVPFENAERFERLMNEAGNSCVLVPFENKDHGFFNYGNADYGRILEQVLGFLADKGFAGN